MRHASGEMATPEELERGERFLAAYNLIERAMQRRAGDPGSKEGFRRLIDHLSGSDWTVSRWKDDLIEFAELRNAIVHERVSPAYLIAVPLEGTVARIERIASLMDRPPLVYPRFRRDVVVLRSDDPARKVLSALRETGYSQFPVYQQDQYLGLVTDGGIARWLAGWLNGKGRDTGMDPLDLTVGEVLKSEKNPDRARFISRNATVYQAESLFESSSGNQWRLAALLITENGDPKEKLLGIITPFDILTPIVE
ncbi:MAG: CBS domain-containing protein [Bacillota bacterium]